MIPSRRSSIAATIVALLLAGCAAPTIAATAWDARVGFEGVHRGGSWTPLLIRPREGEDGGVAPEIVWVDDPDGQPVGYPVGDAVGQGKGARFRVRFGRPTSRIVVEDSTGARATIQLPPALESTEQVLLVVGDLPAAERAGRLLQKEDGARIRVAPVASLADLGPDALDFDGADAIVVCGTALEGAEEAEASLRGIDAWVRRGGRLVLLAGASAGGAAFERTAGAWLPGPLGEQGRVARMIPLRRSAAIETYSRAGRPLDRNAIAGLEVPLLEAAGDLDGTVEAWEGNTPSDLPLVVRHAHGFGTVTWIGIDLDQGAFRTWQGSDSLLVELLGGRVERAGRAGEVDRRTLDLGGQLRLAVDRFEGVRAVPFEVIAGLALLYIGCLYPLEWWVVSRGGRPRLAWLTLPAVVAIFTGIAWWTGDRWKGREPRVHRADVVDVDVAGGSVRGTSFLGVWSPGNTTLTVGASAANPVVAAGAPPATVSWFGVNGRGIGAVDSPTAHPSLAADAYRTDVGLDRLDAVPIAASSSRMFEAEWMGQAAAPAVESTLRRDAQGTLSGLLTSRLPFALEGAALFHAGWTYDVGTLAPGASFDPVLSKGPRTLAAVLTRSATVFDRTQTERWSLGETDVDRILEVAGFHAAAGGDSYTSLEAGRLGRIDLSPLLPIDRAVLVGRAASGTAWTATGATAVDAAVIPAGPALWRIVIPLDKTSGEKRSP